VPHSVKHAISIDFNNAAGNYAVVEIAPHLRFRNVRRGDGENVRLAGALSIIRSLKPFRGRLF
jgi:hypothetical protein